MAATYYAQWELTDYRVQYETRKRTFGTTGAINVIITPWRQVRPVHIKTYEATLQDVDPAVAELPAPSYVAGTNAITANPESLSPTGWEVGQWHQIDMQYVKDIHSPLSRRVRITWEMYGNWQTVEEDDDSGSNSSGN